MYKMQSLTEYLKQDDDLLCNCEGDDTSFCHMHAHIVCVCEYDPSYCQFHLPILMEEDPVEQWFNDGRGWDGMD